MDRIWGGGIVSKIGVVMGSTSDLPVVEKAIHILEEYQVPFEVRVLSAHRCPNEAREFAASARESGFSVLISAAGMAAHLAGALAANTTLPGSLAFRAAAPILMGWTHYSPRCRCRAASR